ncbi:MAG: hypothetical protein K0Q70_1984, partial [Rhodospirillales bacterium]|nr:hypothetical protein [Rhodospirillales bacterium]
DDGGRFALRDQGLSTIGAGQDQARFLGSATMGAVPRVFNNR